MYCPVYGGQVCMQMLVLMQIAPKKGSLMTPRLCAFVLRCVCRIWEGSRENETVLWSLCKKGMRQLYCSHGPQHIFIFSHICCAIYTHGMSMPFPIPRPIYISLYGHLHRAPLFLVTLHLGCSLLWRWLGRDVARQWTPETALSRCCWLSQAASSPTRRNITLSFLKCVTASGVLETAGNSSHACTWAHTHTRSHTNLTKLYCGAQPVLHSSTVETRMVWFCTTCKFSKSLFETLEIYEPILFGPFFFFQCCWVVIQTKTGYILSHIHFVQSKLSLFSLFSVLYF